MPGLKDTLAGLAAARTAFVPPIGGAAPPLRETVAFGDDPGALRMFVHAPPRAAARPALVVVLHGCGQTAAAYARGAGWIELAERHGFVVLAPEQTRANNGNTCFNWFEPADTARNAGEAASIRAMIGRAVADHGVDPARIFVTGLSAGGAMANVMLATYPELFAGGGIVAGLPFGVADSMQEAFGAMRGARRLPAPVLGEMVRRAAPRPARAPRISVWQGRDDTTVRPTCGDDVAAQWAQVADARLASDTGERAEWRSAAGEVVVELHRIAGMGHGTPLATRGPEGCGVAGPFLLEAGVSSSLEMLRFWGLVEARAANVGAREPSPGRRAEPAGAVLPGLPVAALAGVAEEVGEVISGALRKAGLLR